MQTPKALKASNNKLLILAVASNIVAYQVVAQGSPMIGGDLFAALKGAVTLVPATFAAILASVLNAQVSQEMKARIVFWRWSEPLPGGEAFSRHAANDSRVNQAVLEKKFGPLPKARREQNQLWYKLYKSVEKHESVSHVHKEFLFTRDYAALSLLMIPSLGGLAFYQMPWMAALLYSAALVGQYLLVCRAARAHGRSFVTTVLAIKGAGK
ncbi:MAG: hypothetical protein HOP13_15100 [Alphaproteobacteria bacterium]|nr:hypothetical protein [Alphaproteobacteria bacterium]